MLRRARRLRKITDNEKLVLQSKIEQQSMTSRQMAFDTLIKPWEINAPDPVVMFTSVYIAHIYGIFNLYTHLFRSCIL